MNDRDKLERDIQQMVASGEFKPQKGDYDVPDESEISRADPKFVKEIAQLARQLKLAEALIAMHEKERRRFSQQIKEKLREKGLRRVVGDGVSIAWVPAEGVLGDRLTVTLRTVEKPE